MRRVRILLLATVCCAVWWACTEGVDPTAAGRSIGVGIVPSFQVDPSLFATSPIDRVRLVARDAETGAVVGTTDQSVNPSATRWSLSLGIDLGGQPTRDVIVEAELYSGSTVVWSGRLGPFTVPTASPALSLDVYPGPLDNLDVLSLEVAGAPAQLVAGASVTLAAELTLVSGSDATPVVLWASTNPAVATVTPTGSSVTLTAVAAGTADVVVSVGTQDYQFTLQVLPPGSATKTWVGGAAAAATAWSEPANWSPTGVPTSTDDVLIPATANDPVLSAAVSVSDLTVQSGATLDLGDFSIQVSGDLQATGTVATGTVVAGGAAGTLLQGNIDALFIQQSRSATGSLTLTGDLDIAAPFTVNAQAIDVGGSLSTLTGGRLVMTSSGLVTVRGDAIFAGDDQTGSLTAGNLRVWGDFTVGGSTPTAFVATGSNSVSLDGPGTQTITIASPGPSASRFNRLFIDNGGGAVLGSDVYTSDDVFVSSSLTVAVRQNFDVGDVLTLESGSTLDVEGSVTAGGGCVNQGGEVTGSGMHPCGPGPAATRTWLGEISSDWSTPSNWSPAGEPGVNDTVFIQASAYSPALSGDVIVAAITLGTTTYVDLAGYTLSVSGDVDALEGVFYSGTVEVTGAGTVLQGYFDDLRVSAPRSLTNQMYATKNLELLDALDTNGQTAWVGGDLMVDGAGKLVMTDGAATFYVYGNATFNGADHTGALTAGSLSVGGDLLATAASPTSFVSSGTHQLILTGEDQTVTFETPGPNEQRLNDVSIATVSRVTFARSASVGGDFATAGYLVVPAGTTLTIDGTLDLTFGAILEVEGTVFAAVCNAAEAFIFGGGTPPCGTPVSVDRVWLGGDGAAPQDWGTPANWSPAGVPGPAEIVLIPYRTYEPVMSSNRSVGSLLVHYSGYLDLGGWTLSVANDLNVRGYVANGLVQVTGTGTELQGYLDNLRIDAPRSLSGFVTLNGNANVQAKLTIGPQTMYVFGNLDVGGDAGELVLDDASAQVAVQGTTTLEGLRSDLLDGTLYVYGDLVANAPMSTGAAVLLYGDADQTVTLSDPGILADQQHFAALSVVNSGGVVTFASDVHVTETFSAYSSTIARTGNASLEVRGSLGAYDATFSGIPVRIDSDVPPANHVLQNLTFTGYAATDTQLYVRLPGTAAQALTLSSPTFSSAPTPFSGYYIEAVNSLGIGVPALEITLTSPSPTSAPAGTTKVDGNSRITWGP